MVEPKIVFEDGAVRAVLMSDDSLRFEFDREGVTARLLLRLRPDASRDLVLNLLKQTTVGPVLEGSISGAPNAALRLSDETVADMEAQALHEWDEGDALVYAAESVWAAWTRGASECLSTLMHTLRVALDRFAEAPDAEEKPQLNFDRYVSPTFQGLHSDRYESHSVELAVAQLWEAENTQAAALQRRTEDSMVASWEPSKSLLGRLLSRDEDRGVRPSARDWLVASTVVQWLGTPRGRTFFTQLQMAMSEKRDR